MEFGQQEDEQHEQHDGAGFSVDRSRQQGDDGEQHQNVGLRMESSADGGCIFSWGQNAYGELGLGDTEARSVPHKLGFNAPIKQIACGNEITCLLTNEGRVYCCGYNDSGQCGTGDTNRVRTWQLVEGLVGKNVQALASANGCEHVLAITNNGELYAWGYNSRGQLGHGVRTQISSPKLVEAFSRKLVVKVACSYYHTILSTSEDELWGFGRNDFAQLGTESGDRATPVRIPHPSGMVQDLGCGQYHSVFSLDVDGTSQLYTCGKNDYGQLGHNRFGNELATRPLRITLDEWSDATRILVACGYYHTVVLVVDDRQDNKRSCYAFGRNDYGQCGVGGQSKIQSPSHIRVPGDSAPVQISCGCYHTLILVESGQVFGTGRNNHGQLGTSSENDSMIPVKVHGLSNYRVTSIGAGFYHSVCLTEPDTSQQHPTSTLSSDLRNMLNNPARSDVTFHVEGRPIYAHRCILMARCEPLERMLDGPMREAQEKEIILKDLQYTVVLALLEFLYTDQVEGLNPTTVDLDFALDLLVLADQFLVERLKTLCEISIQKSITVENVAVMFRTADVRGATALRKRCFEFMQKNFGRVIGTEGFAALPRELLREILFAAHNKGVSIRP
uniref:BTB domain-containing protein n=1 Tax=Mucochytrium quahogii TaxID=96639 RepID=A0A7S2RFP8_9STRA|mmetsp:Transcript_4170/g.7321  ORF Transcript_4170/g.7321 Transcript_4170/m.7321 type:complete len:616 (-) Transcript_4170:134-1981(-)